MISPKRMQVNLNIGLLHLMPQVYLKKNVKYPNKIKQWYLDRKNTELIWTNADEHLLQKKHLNMLIVLDSALTKSRVYEYVSVMFMA